MKRIIAVLMGLLVATTLLSGAVAATDDTTILDEQVTLTDNTDTAWYELKANETTTDTLSATITYEGLNSTQTAGNGTELKTESVSLNAGETITGEYALAENDTTDYETIRISIEGDTAADADLVASVDYGTTERLSGGGGGGLLGATGASTGVIVAVLAIGYIYMRD